MTRLYLHPSSFLGRGRALRIHNADDHCFTYGFHHHERYTVRWSILVVEPSPGFRHRRLAADCPILSFFNLHVCRFRLRCGKKSSKGFPAIHPIVIANRYQLGRLYLSLQVMQLRYDQRHEYVILLLLGFQKMHLSC